MKRVSRVIDLLPPAAVIMLLSPALAHAYVGPSVAVGFGGAAIGLVFAVFSAIGVLLLWPIKAAIRLMKRAIGVESPTSGDAIVSEDATRAA